MPTLFNVQNLVDLVSYLGISGAAVGNGGADIPISGNTFGRTRSVAGSGSHWLTTDGIEHADSASIEASAARQSSDFFTGVSELG